MCQFNHPNVTRLIGVVTQSEFYSIYQLCSYNSTKKVPTHPFPTSTFFPCIDFCSYARKNVRGKYLGRNRIFINQLFVD